MVKEWNGELLLEWMNKNIGRKGANAPEAYCLMISYGAEIPSGEDGGVDYQGHFMDEVRKRYLMPDWGEVNGNWEEAWLKSPPISHFGHHCNLLPHLEGSAGELTMQMNEVRLGGASRPPLDNWVFGNDHPYEARSTQGAPGRKLKFRLTPDFVSESTNYVVKVVFAFPEDYDGDGGVVTSRAPWSGEWNVGYRSTSGWAHTSNVRFHSDVYEKGTHYTATFRIDDADFEGHLQRADLAIEHVGGEHPSVLMLRVLREDRE